MADLPRIEKFLSTVEGPRQTVGYIPCNSRWKAGKTADYKGEGDPDGFEVMGASGVTIATGVDLGQTDQSTLRKIGVPDGIVNQLIPYIGKKRNEAIITLHRMPLTVSPETAETLDHCVHAHHLSLISRRYDRDAGKGAFDFAPWQAQAVIYSLLYQHGTGGASKFPKTWRALVAQDWLAAALELLSDNWPAYLNRRHDEGALLMEAV